MNLPGSLEITDNDHQEAEEFIRILKPLYTSSLCVSAEKSPTCSQIFPILKKLEAHFEAQHEDPPFTNTLKGTIWGDLSTHYKVRLQFFQYLREHTLVWLRLRFWRHYLVVMAIALIYNIYL